MSRGKEAATTEDEKLRAMMLATFTVAFNMEVARAEPNEAAWRVFRRAAARMQSELDWMFPREARR